MNETRFDAALRAVYEAPKEPVTLDSKVQNALNHQTRVRLIRRRVCFSLAATGAAGFALFALPAVQAQASISGITKALDNAHNVLMTTYTVDENGARIMNGTTLIVGGDWWTRDALGRRESITKGNKQYVFDSTIKEYIVRDHPRQAHIKLSEMLGPTGEFSLGKRAVVEHTEVGGKQMIHAVITNNGLPERYVIDADAKTDLPVSAQVESLERGNWRVRQVMSFEYKANLTIPGPDLAHFKVTTPEAADEQFIKSMEVNTLGSVNFLKGRLVVRSIEVSQEGTVFVAYQSGDHTPRTFNGYALNLTDNFHTRYLRVGQFGSMMEGPFNSPDGKIDMEIFCPENPIPSHLPRKLTLTTQKDGNGKLVRMIQVGVRDSSGHVALHWQLNHTGTVKGEDVTLPVLSKEIAGATCSTHPSWAETLDYTRFSNDISTEMQMAETRGKTAMEDSRWTEAETLFNEELRLMRDCERKGYGPWSQNQVLEYLDQARDHVYKPR